MSACNGILRRIGTAGILVVFGAALMFLGTPKSPASTSGMAPTPPEGTYTIDPAHSFAYFGARHHIVGLVRGRFDKVTGTITSAKNPSDCALDVSIDTSSINTQVVRRDDDLRGPEFFDVKNFPAMTYRGHGIRKAQNSTWIMDGELTIRGVTKQVPLTFRFNGLFPDMPQGRPPRASFHATAAVKRGEFGMTRDNLMELGPNPQSPDVDIEIDVEANASIPTK